MKRKPFGRLRPTRPSAPMVISVIALIVALSGSAVAASTILIKSSSQIKNGVVNSADIANGQVKTADLGTGSVTSSKIAKGAINSTLISDATKRSLTGTGTSAREVVRREGPLNQPANATTRVLTMENLSPGTYVFLGKVIMTPDRDSGNLLDQGRTINAHCRLDVDGLTDDARQLIGGFGTTGPATLNTQLTTPVPDRSTASITCDAPAAWRAAASTLIAIRVGDAPRTDVTG